MNSPTLGISGLVQGTNTLSLGLDAWLKGVLVLAAAGAVYLVWRRASAATRHLIWFLAVASLPFLPWLSFVLPSGPRPLWAVSARLNSGNQVSLVVELVPAPQPATVATAGNRPEAADSRASAYTPGGGRLDAHFSRDWLVLAFAVWGIGTLLTWAYLTAGLIRLRKISQTARPLEDGEWALLVAQASEQLHLRRRVVLLQTSEKVMPLTWGWLRPAILLPAEATDWSIERRRIVLLHELAHVKRWDCLTQWIARIVCALYWCNPLVWLALRRMCIERERACDDLVLNGGCKASEYATHLVEIARTFRRMPQAAGIAMARRSGLQGRVSAIVDASRVRRMRPATIAAALVLLGGLILCVGGWSAGVGAAASNQENSLRNKQIEQLMAFSAAKLKQSEILAASSGEEFSPEYRRFFKAATNGDWQTVTNMYESFKKRHPQYSRVKGVPMDIRLSTAYWSPVLEICLAYDQVANCDPKYTRIAADDIINSIPAGSIYFGGTDPGRGIPTAFSKSQINADPFYVLTQNALADGTYLAYLRNTYGERRHWLSRLIEARRADSQLHNLDLEYDKSREKLTSLLSRKPSDDSECKAVDDATEELRKKMNDRTDEILAEVESRTDARTKEGILSLSPQSIYTPSDEDSQKAFQEYSADAARRMAEHRLSPGEFVTKDENGKVQVRGQVAVMRINALLAKMIFDRNPSREFYVEESFPLDWMYPHLEPHGLIMKIDREPLAQLPEEVLRKDQEFWQRLVGEMIGDWLSEETPVQTVAEFAEKVYLRKDLSGFTGDPNFVRDNYAPKMFSKWRASIGGVYAWRLGVTSGAPTPSQYRPKGAAERGRMIDEADFAFRQAFALCPYSPEAVYRYINFLMSQGRAADALLVAETASHLQPHNEALGGLLGQLKSLQQSR